MFFKASKAFLECQHSHLPLEALSDELRTSASNQVTSEWHQLNINHGGCTNRCDKTMLWLKCEILIHINSPKDYPFKSIQLKKNNRRTYRTHWNDRSFHFKVMPCRIILLKNQTAKCKLWGEHNSSMENYTFISACWWQGCGYMLLLYTAILLKSSAWLLFISLALLFELWLE